MSHSLPGYNPLFEAWRSEHVPADLETGRVIAEHRERYTVATENGEIEAEITGNMRFSAKSRLDFPAVGDWVSLKIFEPDFGIIHDVCPRYSLLQRQAAGHTGEIQIIAANIDYAFLVQAVDRDFNINRLERYLTICYSSDVKPVIVLTKTDLIDSNRLKEIITSITARIAEVPVIALSNETLAGFEQIHSIMEEGKTYCMLGSSGVGKSTLLNNLAGKNKMQTGAISTTSSKGKHVTTHRELMVLDNGSILIDNPGMREVGIADTAAGLETTFDQIIRLSGGCKYKDCTHTQESGCAVLKAVEDGDLDQATYENYMKMQREKSFFESTLAERRKKERQFGKMYKNYRKDIKKYRF